MAIFNSYVKLPEGIVTLFLNKQLDPENSQFLMETSLPTPTTARVYVNLPEGIYLYIYIWDNHLYNGIIYQ